MRHFINLPYWLACLFLFVFYPVKAARLDSYTALDLQLISPSDSNILDVFAKPHTREGRKTLSEIILNPLIDRDLLLRRQEALRFFVAQKNLAAFSGFFKRIGSDEKIVRNIFLNSEQKVILSDVLKSFLFANSYLKQFNTSPLALNTRHVIQSFSPALTAVLEFGVLHLAGKYLTGESSVKPKRHSHCHKHTHDETACAHHKHSNKSKSGTSSNDGHSHKHADCACLFHAKTDTLKGFIKGAVLTAKAAHIALHAVAIKDMVDSLRAKIVFLQHVQNSLDALSRVCTNVRIIVGQLRMTGSAHGILVSELLDQIDQSLVKIAMHKRAVKKVNLHIFSPLGSVVAEYQRLSLAQDDLVQLFRLLGELDVYVAVAQTIISHASKENSYCYVSFAEGEKPLLRMERGWLPVLAQSTDVAIIAQSFSSEELDSQRYVLSGPNGAGKSTFLRCLGYNVVLAQTLGIAAAGTFTITPYQNISSFMSVEDDIKMGLSSFIAKYRRVELLQEIADGLEGSKGLGLFLFDDALGQGTNVVVGEKFALKTLKKFAENKSIFMVAATHFSGVVEHAHDAKSHFKNIHIALKQDDFTNASSSYAVVVGAANLADTTLLVNKGNL